MSAAMKRLSTIIRPGHNKDKSATADEPSTEPKPQDANGATDAKPTETSAEQPAVSSEAPPKDAPTDAVTSEPAAADAPVSTDEPAAAVNGEAEKPVEGAADPNAASKADSTAPSSRRERTARDIGRDTIRRFSSILRAQGKDTTKDPVPPVPKTNDAAIDAPASPATPDATETPAADAPPAEDTVAVAATPVVATKSKKEKEKKDKEKPATDTGKTAKRRSSFFQGLQRSKTPSKPKEVKEKAKVEVVPRLVKKGAAKGKRVIVITGANGTAGLEFVKQVAAQPDAFVIALSRSADRAPELKSLVIASAKRDHNVRALRLDSMSPKSVASTVKEIIELTDGRIDVLINATETRADPTVKMWDIKGAELEEELQSNLIGPIAITNALLPYLKPFEKKKEAAKPTEEEKPKSEEPVAAADGETAATTVEAAPAPDATKEEPDVSSPAEKATTEVASGDATAEATEGGTSAPVADGAEAEGKGTAAAAPPSQPEPATEPEPEPEPFLPSAPFIVFLAPADVIANQGGSVPTGNTFAPAPRNLFTISRAGLQVAIAKYALGLGSRGVGIVGIERAGLNDPHAKVSEEEAVKGVLKLLPSLTVHENGKLLRSDV